MFNFHRQKRNFVVSGVNIKSSLVIVEDLLTGLCIEVPYGTRELERAEFIDEYKLHFKYKDGSEKSVNLLMQGY